MVIYKVGSPRSFKGCWSEILKIGKKVGVDIFSLKRVDLLKGGDIINMWRSLPRGNCLTFYTFLYIWGSESSKLL